MDGTPQKYHAFQEVLAFLTYLHSTGTHGTTELKWNGCNVVFVRHAHGYAPGELPTHN